ncbi:amine oxidase [Oleiphilus messinensis]|uniref:Amine oxidase n=1 Tax=Oleiphilus messinensis TaxID=141451 RepID=A0A1Y0I9F3_9GAMM|nr:NAD(P)/FAD-dependent oxidoreductase [Oleiphilus messinensis]ARU56023.1 amine oxidase [Oleiphilus messinensis]
MQKKIAVVGAGPMGLAVAYHLLKAGHQVDLFEADKVAGGMSATFDFDGLQIERYYHFICKEDLALFELLKELKIIHKLKWQETKMGFFYDGHLYEWGNPLALLRFPKLGLIAKLRYGLMAYLATKRRKWLDLDKKDALSWIITWVGRDAYNVLWKKLFELKFYQYSSSLSAAWIWSRIRRVGNSRKSMMTESLGYLEGGSDTLINSLVNSIEDLGGRVHLGCPVEQVMVSEGKVEGIRVNGQKQDYNNVVSTIPAVFIPRLMPFLPQKLLDKFERLVNIPVVCVIVKLKNKMTDNFWLNINDETMDIPGMVEYTNLNALDCHIVYVPYYMPEDNPKFNDSDECFKEKARRYIKSINPEILDDDVISIHVSRYRFAQPVCGPEFLAQLPSISLPVEGLFAADTSYYYPEDRGISESVGLAKKIADMV